MIDAIVIIVYVTLGEIVPGGLLLQEKIMLHGCGKFYLYAGTGDNARCETSGKICNVERRYAASGIPKVSVKDTVFLEEDIDEDCDGGDGEKDRKSSTDCHGVTFRSSVDHSCPGCPVWGFGFFFGA